MTNLQSKHVALLQNKQIVLTYIFYKLIDSQAHRDAFIHNYNTLSSQITTNIPDKSGHFHVTRGTSDMDTCLCVNNVTSLDSPCQNVYIILKNESNFNWRPPLQTKKHQFQNNIFRSSNTATPHMIRSFPHSRNNVVKQYTP